ncbi:hypothetical protein HHX47_DHR5000466 [Lentinula edodes]|nr:hypothetical protein HHX47_DHR5000466 [Lentinula edodes]
MAYYGALQQVTLGGMHTSSVSKKFFNEIQCRGLILRAPSRRTYPARR